MVVTKIVPLEDHCDIPITNVVNSESKKPTTQNEKLPEMTRLFQKGYPMPLGVYIQDNFRRAVTSSKKIQLNVLNSDIC